MTPSRWSRVKSVFSRARAAAHPEHLLERLSPSMAEEVQRLLDAAETSSQTAIRLQDSEGPAGPAGQAKALFETGTRVAGRFDIVRLLGRGGMGEVYEARDVVKEQSVALKLLRLNPSLDAQSAERLVRKEVALAQRVSHRNICRMYDPYRHEFADGEAILLLSMELLRGRTLAELCAERGRLPPDEALIIARQIAAGIDAAHAAGIVHRDLKPSNVMLVDALNGARVVVTDFGLARSQVEGMSSPTITQGVAGTLRYMAPEQQADARSDLYTFCLLLFELVTGQQPFAGTTDISLALSRLSMPPRDPAEFVPGLPLAWRKTLLQGLDRDPTRRYASAGQIIASLESHSHPWTALPQIAATKALRRRPWLRWTLLPAFVALAAIMAYVWRPAATPLAPFTRLLIVDLEHAPSADQALLGADAILSSTIAQSPYLVVTRPAELAESLKHMGWPLGRALDRAAIRELALRTGQSAVLTGQIARRGSYVLHLDLEELGGDPRYGGPVASHDYQAGDERKLFDAIAAAAQWVRQLSGEGTEARNEQNARPEDLTTSSWKALNLLQQARNRRDADDAQSALIFAAESLELDPGFAAAQSLRGDVLAQLGRYKEGFAAHRDAVELAKRRNITGRERYRIEAVYDDDAENLDALSGAAKAWIAHFPNDYLPHFYLARLLEVRGEYISAAAQLEQARQLNPKNYAAYPHLARCYLELGQPERARECARALRHLGEADWAREVEGQILLSQHRFDEAIAMIAPLQDRQDDVFSELAPACVANALADSGRLKAAEDVLAAAAAADSRKGLRARQAERQVAIAYLRYLQGNRRGVRPALVPFLNDLDHPDSVSEAGGLLARTGDASMARHVLALLDRWPDVPVANRARTRLRAEISLATGRRADEAGLPAAESTVLPLDLDLLLHAAVTGHQPESVIRLRRRITESANILIDWGERWVPGLYWAAACASPGSTRKPHIAGNCPAS